MFVLLLLAVTLPPGVTAVSFGRGERFKDAAGKEMCSIARPLPEPAAFERGVTEISYGVGAHTARGEKRLGARDRTRRPGSARRELQYFHARKGRLQPDSAGQHDLTGRQAAARARLVSAANHPSRPHGRDSVFS